MRDSDWSREILLRSDWLLPSVAIMTTRQYLVTLLRQHGFCIVGGIGSAYQNYCDVSLFPCDTRT